jgi:hypothetical protein
MCLEKLKMPRWHHHCHVQGWFFGRGNVRKIKFAWNFVGIYEKNVARSHQKDVDLSWKKWKFAHGDIEDNDR